jgi:uncharacterized membrane protein YccC
MEPDENYDESLSQQLVRGARRFLGGGCAGLIACALVGWVGDVQPKLWLILAILTFCGCLGVLTGQGFKSLLSSFLDQAPWF